MNILFVSAYLPHDKVPHAGGRTHLHYVRRFAEDSSNQVEVIGFVPADEMAALDLKGERFKATALEYPNGRLGSILHKSWRVMLRLFPKVRHGGVVSPFQERSLFSILRWRAQNGYSPDLIVLEWSQMALLAYWIKQVFPHAKIVSSLHDCLFQWAARTAESVRPGFSREVLLNRASFIREIEPAALQLADLVLVQSAKDAALLQEVGVPLDRVQVISPRFVLPDRVPDRVPSRDIVFFGAMDRVENHSACEWFLDEVMPRLRLVLPGFRFLIVGARPPERLTRRSANDVVVTGFVPEATPYFQTALCLVAPLRMGAGIKVKVLEGMAAGLPVLTNDVGIEGIPGSPGVHYLHCSTPEEYVRDIQKLADGEINGEEVGRRARDLVCGQFDLNDSYRRLNRRLASLLAK